MPLDTRRIYIIAKTSYVEMKQDMKRRLDIWYVQNVGTLQIFYFNCCLYLTILVMFLAAAHSYLFLCLLYTECLASASEQVVTRMYGA